MRVLGRAWVGKGYDQTMCRFEALGGLVYLRKEEGGQSQAMGPDGRGDSQE